MGPKRTLRRSQVSGWLQRQERRSAHHSGFMVPDRSADGEPSERDDAGGGSGGGRERQGQEEAWRKAGRMGRMDYGCVDGWVESRSRKAAIDEDTSRKERPSDGGGGWVAFG